MPYRIIIAVFAAFLGAGAFWMFLPLLSVALRSRGVGDFWVGIVSSLPWLGLLAMAGFIPAVIRRLGLQRMVLSGMIAASLVFLGFAATHNVLLWGMLCLILGGALALRWAGLDTWINGSFPAHLRGRLTGLYELIMSGSMAVGPGILAISGGTGAAPFLAGAAATAGAAILLTFAGRETPQTTQPGTQSARRLDILLHEPGTFISIFLVGLTEACNLSLLPLYGLSQGLSVHLSALLVAAVQSGVALGAALIGTLADHLNRQKLCNASICAMVLLPLGLVLEMKNMLWPWLFIWGSAQGGLFTLGIVSLTSRHSGLGLASAMSISMIVYTLGGIIGPPAMGFCMALLGPRGFATGLALLAFAGALAISRSRATGPAAML